MTTRTFSQVNSRPQALIAWVMLLAFAVQTLIPLGYMPAALSSGAYIQLCPQGLSPEVMALFHDHGINNSTTIPSSSPSQDSVHEPHLHHVEPDTLSSNEHNDSWRADCPFGAVAPNFFALGYIANLSFVLPQSHSPKFELATPDFPTVRGRSHQARAPPNTTC